MDFQVGDYVTRISHNSDIVFKIVRIEGERVILRSFRTRLMADCRLNDLRKYKIQDKGRLKKQLLVESLESMQRQKRNFILADKNLRDMNHEAYREKPVKVLHIDGDRDYLDLSLQNYRNLQINATGLFIPEKGQPDQILSSLLKYRPDILILTGHDGEVNNRIYHTSRYFIKSVREARNYNSDLDELIIVAGACQSDYQALINCGANFASSPGGGLIHFLDPVMVVEKIAHTSVREMITVKDVVKCTLTGEGGIGGVETRGKLRLLYP